MATSHPKYTQLENELKAKHSLKGFGLPSVEIDGVVSGGSVSVSSLPPTGLEITIPAGDANGPSGDGVFLMEGFDSGHAIERDIDKVLLQSLDVVVSKQELSAFVGEESYIVYTVVDEGSEPFFINVVA